MSTPLGLAGVFGRGEQAAVQDPGGADQVPRRPPWPAGAHWGFLAFFVGYGGYSLASMVVTVAMSGRIAPLDPMVASHPGPLLLFAVLPNLLLGLVPLACSWRWGGGWVRDFGILPTWRDVRVGLVCGVASLVLGLVLTAVLLKVYGSDATSAPGSPGGVAVSAEGHTGWLVVYVMFLLVGAPCTEELLIRGALWAGLEHHQLHRYVILAITALVFAFVHPEPWRTASLFAQGLAIGTARMRTGRIGSSIVAHVTNNLLPALHLLLAAAPG